MPSFTAGVLLVPDESRNLDPVSEPYIGDDFPQTG
jgi:hypothetical protein